MVVILLQECACTAASFAREIYYNPCSAWNVGSVKKKKNQEPRSDIPYLSIICRQGKSAKRLPSIWTTKSQALFATKYAANRLWSTEYVRESMGDHHTGPR